MFSNLSFKKPASSTSSWSWHPQSKTWSWHSESQQKHPEGHQGNRHVEVIPRGYKNPGLRSDLGPDPGIAQNNVVWLLLQKRHPAGVSLLVGFGGYCELRLVTHYQHGTSVVVHLRNIPNLVYIITCPSTWQALQRNSTANFNTSISTSSLCTCITKSTWSTV